MQHFGHVLEHVIHPFVVLAGHPVHAGQHVRTLAHEAVQVGLGDRVLVAVRVDHVAAQEYLGTLGVHDDVEDVLGEDGERLPVVVVVAEQGSVGPAVVARTDEAHSLHSPGVPQRQLKDGVRPLVVGMNCIYVFDDWLFEATNLAVIKYRL